MRRLYITTLMFALSFSLFADKVVYTSGGRELTLEGVIIEDNLNEIVIEWDLGQKLEIPKSSIKSTELGNHPAVKCRKLYAEALQKKTVEKWLELGRMAVKSNLKNYKREAFEQVLAIDPQNKEAHEGRGDVKYKGKWHSKAEVRLSKKWEEKIGDLQTEFIGRPWAIVAPIKTNFFQLKCNSTEEVAKRYQTFLEKALFPLYNRLFPKSKFKQYHSEPGKIYIMANVGEFRNYTMVPAGVGGFFSPTKNEVYTFHGSFGIRGTTMHILAHEALHVYQWRIFKNMSSVPTWLIEGMAVYFGDGAQFGFNFRDNLDAIRSDAITIVPPLDRVTPLKLMIQAGQYYPLKRLLVLPHRAFTGRFYSNAWLVIFWCLDGQKYGQHHGEGKKLLDEYILHASTMTGKGGFDNPKHLNSEAAYFAKLVQKYLGKDIDTWDKNLQDFITDLKLKPLGKWQSGRWTGLGLVLRCPPGFTIADQDSLSPGEVVAFGARVGSYPRIAVCARSNDFLARTKPALVSHWIQELYSDIDWVTEPKITEKGIWPPGTVEAIFTGKRRKSMLPGQKKEASPKIKIRFRAMATASRVYFFMCESTEKRFKKDNEKYFSHFIEKKGVQLSN